MNPDCDSKTIFHYSFFIAILTACAPTVEPPQPVSLRVTTVSAGAKIVSAAADTFSAEYPNVTVSVTELPTVRAIEAVWNGDADAAMVSALLPGAERFEQIPVTRDGIAIIAHPDNPVDGVTLLELQKLFSGEIYRWDDIPHGAGDVTVAVRERDSGTRTVFDGRIMEDRRITPTARVFPDAASLRAFVAQTPGAVGYISAALADDSVKVLAVEDIFPAPENLADGAYPLSYPLYLLIPAEASPELRALARAMVGG